jgi:hypothetical protein
MWLDEGLHFHYFPNYKCILLGAFCLKNPSTWYVPDMHPAPLPKVHVEIDTCHATVKEALHPCQVSVNLYGFFIMLVRLPNP